MEKIPTVLTILLIVCSLVYVAGCTGETNCDDLQGQDEKNKCYFDKAVADKTPDLCEKITSTAQKKDCAEKAK